MYVAQQDAGELERFAMLLRQEDVCSYLEVGSKNGGSLWNIANILPVGSRVVAIDLPHGTKESQPSLEACIADLNALGYDAHLILGDSTDSDVIAKAKALGPFDACFIDANHTLPYVTKDWENYGALCRLVAFHDIGWKREERAGRLPINVPQFWNSIKDQYRFIEIRECETDNGIGVLWRS